MWWRDRKAISLVALFFYWLLFNYFVLHNPLKIFHDLNVSPLTEVESISSAALSPSTLLDAQWQSTQLPDDWYHSQRQSQQVWYRATTQVDKTQSDVWGIYLPSVTHNAAVYINDVWVGQGGGFHEPVSRHHNEPLLFTFSSELLKTGSNQVHLRVKASFHEQGLLDEFYLAPASQLYDAYWWKHFLRVDFIKWITLAMFGMAMIVFAFWMARRQDVIYGLFSLELFFWATHNLNLFVSEIPVSARVWEAMTMSTLGWTICTMIFFNHRYVGYANKSVEKIVLLFAVLGVGMFLLPDIQSVLHIGYRVWDAFLIIFGSYAIFHLIKVYLHNKDHDVYLMLLAGIPILVFGFHDILLVNHFWDRRDGLIIQYSVIPAALLFSWFLVRRFVQSINHAEALTATLEQRIKEKEMELREQFEKLRALQKEQVLSEERERIMRDMHDGIGGQLVSVVTMLQEYKGEVFRQLQEKVNHSLTDLRFVIDSLDPLLNDLPTLLGMMRMRLEDQLEAAKIKLHWNVDDLPEIPDMSPRKSLHIMRIVQEAITNSIKHSQSKELTLATGLSECGNVYIDIVDTGKGFELNEDQIPGRGLNNMYYRAQQIKGRFEISSTRSGTRARLLLPYS